MRYICNSWERAHVCAQLARLTPRRLKLCNRFEEEEKEEKEG